MLTLVLAGGLNAGCVGPLYDNTGGSALSESVTPVDKWRIEGNLREIQSAIDGDLFTAAAGSMGGNDAITIDLSKVCYFNMIVIDHGVAESGYARRVAVLTSLSGNNYVYQKSGPGNRRVTVMLLDRAVLARYVRIQVVMPGADPWSIAEVYFQ